MAIYPKNELVISNDWITQFLPKLLLALDQTPEHLFTKGEVLGYRIVGEDGEQPLSTEPHWGNYPKHINVNIVTDSYRGLVRGIVCEERIKKSCIV